MARDVAMTVTPAAPRAHARYWYGQTQHMLLWTAEKIERLKIERDVLAARVAELEAALRFYADDENWTVDDCGVIDGIKEPLVGQCARAALVGGKEEDDA